MAESVKRRVAAARLAVAFVAAGAIAGASAWASAGPPPRGAGATASAEHIKKAEISTDDIIDGSLLFEDFKKGEVPSFRQFVKLDAAFNHFKKATNKALGSIKGELGDIKLTVETIQGNLVTGYVKRSDLDGYIKMADADARYYNKAQPLVNGDASVFTGDGIVANQLIGLLDVPSMIKVEGIGSKVRFTNTSPGDLQHTACLNGQTPVAAGTLKQGAFIECDAGGTTQSMQFFGSGGGEGVTTVSFSGVPVTGGQLDTVQILVGL